MNISRLLLVTGFWVLAFGPAPRANGATASVLLRFAVLGDAEPKPEAVFPGLQKAVTDVNAMAARMRVDFVVGGGRHRAQGYPPAIRGSDKGIGPTGAALLPDHGQ